MPPDNVSTLAITDLVLDAGLQCRVAIDDAVVEEYAEALAAGVVFPPIRVVDTGEQLLVVDGWHRVIAHEEAEITEVHALVEPGTRRDALLAAVRANNDHGLRRTRDDKGRAVKVLLMDPDWCRLSNRELGDLAGVSHAFVGLRRKAYGTLKGDALTEARIEEVDGELPARWRALVEACPTWDRDWVQVARTAQDLVGLQQATVGAAHRRQEETLAAIEYRLEELAAQAATPWPWPDDVTEEERAARAAGLDTVEDLERATLAEGCPDRRRLLEVWQSTIDLTRAVRPYDVHAPTFEGRPALEQAARARRDELEAAKKAPKADPYSRAQAIRRAPEPEAIDLILAAPRKVLLELQYWRAESPAVVAALRLRLEGLNETTRQCADPRCDGWWWQTSQKQFSACFTCHAYQANLGKELRNQVDVAGSLVLVGWPLAVGEVTITRAAVELLGALADWADGDPEGAEEALAGAPEEVPGLLRAWLSDIAAADRAEPRESEVDHVEEEEEEEDSEEWSEDDDLDDEDQGDLAEGLAS